MAKKQKQVKTRNAAKPVVARKSKTATSRSKKPSESIQPSMVRGTISYPNKSPASGLTVIAFDKDVAGENILGESITEPKGGYRIAYTAAKFRLTKNERRGADVFVRVYDAEKNVLFQSKTVNNAPADLLLNVQLPAKTFVVRGQIRLANGSPCAGASVRAYDKDLRSKEQMGKPTPVTADKNGRYEIVYTAEQFSRAEKRSADLLVEARQKKEANWIAAPIRFNAQPVEIIDITLDGVYRGPSEFRRLVDEITPLLDGLTLAQLTENADFQDITFLSNETEVDRQRISLLAQAATLEQEVRLLTDRAPVIEARERVPVLQATGIPAEVFYGWFRQGLPTDWKTLQTRPIGALRKALLDAIDQNIISDEFRKHIESVLVRIPNPQVTELVTALAGTVLSQEKLSAVLTHVDAVAAVSDEVLTQLVEKKALAAHEAESVGLHVSLHRLSGGEPSLMSAMLDSEFAVLKTGKLQQARDLAALDPEDWASALDKTGFIPLGGATVAEHARNLAMQAAGAFPHAAFTQRATRIPMGMNDQLNKIRPVLETNSEATLRDFDALDLTGVSEQDIEGVRAAHTTLKRLANLHPGLDLHDVFSKQQSVGNAIEVVGERIGWLRTVFELNPNVGFLDLDYLPDSADLNTIKFGSLSDDARSRVVANLKANKRVYAIANNPIAAIDILQAGFNSASAIARTRAVDFAEKLGIQQSEARAYHDTARELANEAAVHWHTLHDAARDKAAMPIRAIPSQNEFFRPLTGFQELLDDQPWCDCSHCQSVLSPAAYFVDLMYYIEQNILKDSFKNQTNHPLHLQIRRPDLWELELTCKNTDEYVPYLDVVNEILERYIKESAPPPVGTTVYQHLAAQRASFQQPFTLPMERLEILLGHFGLSRYDVANAMGADRTIQSRARLTISQQEFSLITTALTNANDWPIVKQLFKLQSPASVASSNALLPSLEMQTLLHATSLTHDSVAAVLKTHFVDVDGSTNAKITVVIGKRTPDDVQNNSELVSNLSLERLDRIHRFIRLWRKLPWTIEELDYVLTWMASPGQSNPNVASRIDTGSLTRILDLLDVNAAWSLPIDELMSLADTFPSQGLRESTSLFDRLFNQPPFLDRDGQWPPTAIKFSHPAWRKVGNSQGVSDPDNNTLSRLLAGLQVSDKELVELITSLATIPALGYQQATATADESISLSAQTIGILYRHARLMRLLKIKIADFIKLTKLTPRIATRPLVEQYIRDLDDVISIVEFAAWQRTSGFGLDEIAYVTGDANVAVLFNPAALNPPPLNPASLADEIIATVAAEKSFEFADTVFTQLGLTDVQSRQIVIDNTTTTATNKAFEKPPGSAAYRLLIGVDPANAATLLMLDATIDEPSVRGLLGKYHFLAIFDALLAGAFKLSREQVATLRALAHPVLNATEITEITAALQSGQTKTRLIALIAEMLRFRALFKSKVFDAQGLNFVRDNKAIFFSLPGNLNNAAITTQVIRNVAAYAGLATATDQNFTTASGPANANVIQAVVTTATGVGNAGEENLAKTLRTDKTRIGALKPHILPLPSNPFDALAVLARCLVFTEQLGVSGETLKLIAADTVEELSRAAEDVFGAFRAKYPVEKTFQEKIEPFEDKLRSRKRDALVDFVISKWPEPFADANKLYEYFLIDVLMEGCARTSRVVSGMSSLQLYVHRVLMNLEMSKDWDGSVPAKHGVYAYFTDADKRNEWYWRKHYRVWEANRKVFLYPENYIEPELRDDKTPLFKELEDTLLQQEISDSNAHDAYARYLTGFDEVARLKIAGAYYVSDADTLHLFGVTQDAPPIYYYRVVEKTKSAGQRISAWKKLNLQIPVRKVSALLFEERLYLFWLETTTRPRSSFKAGDSQFSGYRHLVRIKYSMLRPDGAWTPPQGLSFEKGVSTEESRMVDDPLTGAEEKLRLAKEIADLEITEGDRAREAGEAEGAAGRAATASSIADGAAVTAELSVLGGPTVLEAAEAGLGVGVALAELVKDEVARNVKLGVAVALQGVTETRLKELATALASQDLIAAGIALTKLTGSLATLALALAEALVAPYLFRRAIALLVATLQAKMAADAKAAAAAEETRTKGVLQKVRDDLADLRLLLAGNKISVRWDKSSRDHSEPLDNYKPEGWEWDRVYADAYSAPSPSKDKSIRLVLVPRNDLAATITSDEIDLTSSVLHTVSSPNDSEALGKKLVNAYGQVLEYAAPYATAANYAPVWQRFYRASSYLNTPTLSGTLVARAPTNADMQIVNGEPSSVIIESKSDVVVLRKTGTSYLGTRLATTLTPTLAKEFGHQGANTLLNPVFQEWLTEAPSKISPVEGQSDPLKQNPFHSINPYLTYFRETFFHIPFLVANHLNSQQKFAEAQRWYHHIFNPTAADGLAWRYREFRNPTFNKQSLREMLTDPIALAAYRADPFNPHAIARTRLSAYQKSIVMKYIDNLLDWGDSLFGQFTMESVNEASMLYVMAQDILGPRPPILGSCGEGEVFSEKNKKNYLTIRAGLSKVNDFLIELEMATTPANYRHRTPADETSGLVITMTPINTIAHKTTGGTANTTNGGSQPMALRMLTTGPMAPDPSIPPLAVIDNQFNAVGAKQYTQAGGSYWTSVGGVSLQQLHDSHGGGMAFLGTDTGTPRIPGNKTGNIDFIHRDGDGARGEFGVPGGDRIKQFDQIPPLDIKYTLHDRYPPTTIVPDGNRAPPKLDPADLVPSTPKNTVFCIPPNKDLLAYWDRVEDRLFKIRNCMDIAGVRRGLELFAPEIDPRLLVRMKAAGLTLDDVLNATAGNLPPYRFTYLIEKARQYAGTLQSFGSQLLSAIEKRDGEELNQLRTVHEQNLLKMRTRMTQLEIDAAEDALEGLRRQKAAAQYRQDYFRSLSEVGLLASERTQQEHQREASNFRTMAGLAQVVASILTIIPDMGAPTAMKFGGSQLGAAGRAVAEGMNALAAFNEMSASMAGMESSNRRRDQDWKHQAETAKRDISQIEKQIAAAEIRRDISMHALEVHEKSIEQSEEIFDLFRDKFSNFGRYTLLSNQLHGLYRVAFNSALSMAKMTEQAYRAERTDDLTMLDGAYWDADNAGLLAGERLLNDLQGLERQYIETNYRQLEVEQSFSLAQLAPDKLATLRLTGKCTFDIPEWFFDLTYPGQYRRRLKAVRLTIPCVTGPYTNVGATLRLESSEIRLKPLAQPTTVPLRHTVAIAASKAQYDAGVFDFNFRDERYMPFEGAGAISTWQLSLPKTLRVFDYGTISDVVLHLSYTADFDGVLKDNTEAEAAGIIADLKSRTLTRSFSLRREFPDVFHRISASQLNTEIGFTIEPQHFPFFLTGHPLQVSNVNVQVLSSLANVAGARLTIGERAGSSASPQTRALTAPPASTSNAIADDRIRQFDFAASPATQTYKGVASRLVGDYMIKLTAAGALAPAAQGNAIGAIDPEKLHDIILEIQYSLAP